jgi:hypothetical protein
VTIGLEKEVAELIKKGLSYEQIRNRLRDQGHRRHSIEAAIAQQDIRPDAKPHGWNLPSAAAVILTLLLILITGIAIKQLPFELVFTVFVFLLKTLGSALVLFLIAHAQRGSDARFGKCLIYSIILLVVSLVPLLSLPKMVLYYGMLIYMFRNLDLPWEAVLTYASVMLTIEIAILAYSLPRLIA